MALVIFVDQVSYGKGKLEAHVPTTRHQEGENRRPHGHVHMQIFNYSNGEQGQRKIGCDQDRSMDI